MYNNQPGNIKPSGPESIVIPTDIQDEKAIESAIFISDNFNISKKLLMNIGFRYSFYAFLGETSQSIYLEICLKMKGH